MNVKKVPGAGNRADIMTKFLEGDRFFMLLALLPLRILMRCSAENGAAKAVAFIMLLPSMAEAREELDAVSVVPTLILMGIWLLIGLLMGHYIGARAGRAVRSMEVGTQTERQTIVRYWEMARDQVIELAAARHIPEACRYRVTRAELVHRLLEQDLRLQ